MQMAKIVCTKVFILSFYLVNTTAWASGPIFSCVDIQGKSPIRFQDRPCALTHQQGILEDRGITSIMSPSPLSALESNPLEALAVAKERARAYRQAEAAYKREKRLEGRQARQAKQLQQAQLRAERRHLRCQSTLEKIRTIEARLRQGSKISQVLRLREQLKTLQIKKERYCLAETT